MQVQLPVHHNARATHRATRCDLLRCHAHSGKTLNEVGSQNVSPDLGVSLYLTSRRRLLLGGTLLVSGAAAPRSAQAEPWFGVLAARKILRPDGDQQQALVELLDARGILKEVAQLAATPADSQERFNARALLPGMAKRLRNVAQAAPVVAAVISGDKESTLSEKYGGTGASGSSLTDPVYETVGRVLTISGRSINPDALASPEPALQAVDTLEKFLSNVPKDQLDEAQAFRVKRFSNN